MSIISLIEQIRSKEIVLPAIQRNFVWSERKISKLCDSVMRGYPIGIILQWETYNDIQYRHFKEEFQQDPIFTFHENPKNKRLKLVLDGQQRLQSLYIALYGTYEGKSLYFDVLSGRESEDFREDKFIFTFMSNAKAKKLNNDSISIYQDQVNGDNEDNSLSYFVRVKDLISSGAKDKQVQKKRIIKLFNLS